MASLFLVNGNPNQNWRFYYRVPEQDHGDRPPYIDVPMGGQRELRDGTHGGGFSDPAIDDIVRKNLRFGWVEAGDRLPPRFVPALWSRKPISDRHVLEVRDHNIQIMRNQARERRGVAAAAIAQAIEEGLHTHQMPDQLVALETVVQEQGTNADADDAIRVERTPTQREELGYRQRNRRRRASE